MKCRCGKTLMEFTVVVSGHELTLRHCSNCDFHSWTEDGQSLELNKVLDLVATSGRRSARSS